MSSAQQITEVLLSLDNHGYRPRREVFAGIRDGFCWTRAPAVRDIEAHWRQHFPDSAIGRAGLHETLQSLSQAGIRLGVVTNGGEYPQSTKIARLNIAQYFSSVVISEVVGCKKPDPRIFQFSIDQMSCDPSRTLFVGDHPINDVMGAEEVGLVPVWFEGVHAWPASHPLPLRRVRSLPEVLQFVSTTDARPA